MQSSKEKVDISSLICVAIQKSSCSGYENGKVALLQSVQESCDSDISKSPRKAKSFQRLDLLRLENQLDVGTVKIQRKVVKIVLYGIY